MTCDMVPSVNHVCLLLTQDMLNIPDCLYIWGVSIKPLFSSSVLEEKQVARNIIDGKTWDILKKVKNENRTIILT